MRTASARHFSRLGAVVGTALSLVILVGCVPEPETPSSTAPATPDSSATASASPTEGTPSTEPTPTPAPSASGDGEAGELVTITTVGVESGAIEAAGVVTTAPTAGGTCTLTASQGTTVVDATADATAGAETMFCGLLSIPTAGLASGTWTVTLSYSSPSATGSATTEVSIP